MEVAGGSWRGAKHGPKKIQEERRRDLLKSSKKIVEEDHTVFKPAVSPGFRPGLRNEWVKGGKAGENSGPHPTTTGQKK